MNPRRDTGQWDKDFAAALAKAAEDIKKIFTAFRLAADRRRAARTPEQVELLSKARYRRAVADERAKGLAFVKAEAARVRRELGL